MANSRICSPLARVPPSLLGPLTIEPWHPHMIRYQPTDLKTVACHYQHLPTVIPIILLRTAHPSIDRILCHQLSVKAIDQPRVLPPPAPHLSHWHRGSNSLPHRYPAPPWSRGSQYQTVTDKAEARLLSELLRVDYLPEVWLPDEQTEELRHWVNDRQSNVDRQTEVKKRIHSSLHNCLLDGLNLFGSKEGAAPLDRLEATQPVADDPGSFPLGRRRLRINDDL